MTTPADQPPREGAFVRFIAPPEPSRLRLGLLWGLLLFWLAVLVILYITTVRPVRQAKPPVTQTAATAASICEL